MIADPAIYIACDTTGMDQCREWAALANSHGQGLKLGLEFFTHNGPAGVERIQDDNPDMPLFLDLKLHDIPNTVGAAMRSVCERVTPGYINVHASGGEAMMRAARENCPDQTRVLGVTVLTSFDADTLASVGQDDHHQAQVVRLAELAKTNGLDGVVCAAAELEALRASTGDDFICMTPGIRPAGSTDDDQKRISTPAAAIAAGASHLVIGRPITQADDPDAALEAICREIDEARHAATG